LGDAVTRAQALKEDDLAKEIAGFRRERKHRG
jgi:hypothetical protein